MLPHKMMMTHNDFGPRVASVLYKDTNPTTAKISCRTMIGMIRLQGMLEIIVSMSVSPFLFVLFVAIILSLQVFFPPGPINMDKPIGNKRSWSLDQPYDPPDPVVFRMTTGMGEQK